ncbi:MAG: DNA topoisomerase [Candidatus Hodarchaeales archaeon]|jgi:DNA topoisomerase IA
MASTLLMVAEKPSIARALVKAFSIKFKLKFTKNKSKSRYNPVYNALLPEDTSIEIVINDSQAVLTPGSEFKITSVLGHLLNFEYSPPYDKKSTWKLDNLQKMAIEDPNLVPVSSKLYEQLEELGRNADYLVIATDWDSHGESIGNQIMIVASRSNANLQCGRMKFTSVGVGAVVKAFKEQVALDQSLIQQVDSLRKQDLRMGAIITRFLTVGLKEASGISRLLSYGPCQSSVLWIINERYKEKQAFQPEELWNIRAIQSLEGKEEPKRIVFNHVNQDFSEKEARKLYQALKTPIKGRVETISTTREIISRPLPLDTDTIESDCARLFRISPKMVADLAEQLYNVGLITYPRTESSYYLMKDLNLLREKFEKKGDFIDQAKICRKQGMVNKPSSGKFTKDHEPIMPVKSVTREEFETILEKISEWERSTAWKIYSYVVLRFLATISKDAVKEVIKHVLNVERENFQYQAEKVIELGFLKIYPYKKIREKEKCPLKEGEKTTVQIELDKSYSTPPLLYTESDLLREMVKFGIGTDATRSTHIDTVLKRKFAKIIHGPRGRTLYPTMLGHKICEIFNQHAPELVNPEIRSTVEQWTQKIREGEIIPEEVDNKVIELTVSNLKTLEFNIKNVFDEISEGVQISTKEGTSFGWCPIHPNSPLILRSSSKGKRFIRCERENCNKSFPLPKKGLLRPLDSNCTICNQQPISVGTGTKNWILCPNCWVSLMDDTGPFFCSKCKEENCSYSSEYKGMKSKGFLGTCPICNTGEVFLFAEGTLTTVFCINPECKKEWKAPNIRTGTSIQVGGLCKLCGLRTLVVKRLRKRPYHICTTCSITCFQCTHRCFD